MKRSPPDIVSHLDPNRATTDWIQRIATRARAYLDDEPDRPEAAHLREVLRYATLAREALKVGNAEAAAHATLACVMHAWNAELVMGRAIVRAGLGTKRGGEKGGRKRRPESARARIEEELRTYSGRADRRVETIAKRTGVTETWVRRVIQQQAKR